MKENNPFLDKQNFPNFKAMTPELARFAINQMLEEAKKNIFACENIELKDLNYKNFISALDKASEGLDYVWGLVNHLDSVSNSEELRKLINEFLPIVTEYHSSIPLNEKLWDRLDYFYKNHDADKLKSYEKILVKEMHKDFVRNGSNLSIEKKARLKELDRELAELTQKFSENVLDDTKSFEFRTEDELFLKGLPESSISYAKKKASEKGINGYLFTLEAPSMIPVLTYAENENFREKIWRSFSNLCRGGNFDNSDIVRRILSIRNEQAKILGKETFADFVLEDRMAKDGKIALDFVDSLHKKIIPYFKKDVELMQNFSAKELIEPWNVSYLAEKMRKKFYDFDGEEFRPYFELDKCLEGIFSIAEILFGLKIKKGNASVWHDSVLFFDVENENGQHIASFYADLFPRSNKRAGAWMNTLKFGENGNPTLGLIAGNFIEPTSDKPSLLNFDELTTLAHELGHLFHFILMDCPETSLRTVAWDFVELPSQVMENWFYKKEILDRFALHYRTNEKIPNELFDKFDRAKKFREPSACNRQLSFAKIDLELHHNTDKFLAVDIETMALKVLEDYRMPYSESTPTILSHFSHIFGDAVGYAAGYYSYKWAEVLDADVFSRFEKEGLLNKKLGREFANKILRVGETVPPLEAFESFMGRSPDMEAFLRKVF